MSSGATGSALDHNSPGFPLNFLSHLATTFTPESEVHQGITKEGLNFLNENVVNKINTGHEFADFISKNQDDPTFHFDSCTFDGATANIKNRYGNILELIQKGDLNSQRGAYEQFGEILHTAVDFYSHSNWVELQKAGYVPKGKLIDDRKDYWKILHGNDMISGTNKPVKVIEGTVDDPSLTRTTSPNYDSHIVYVNKGEMVGLISSVS